jgi:hypothetical protein
VVGGEEMLCRGLWEVGLGREGEGREGKGQGGMRNGERIFRGPGTRFAHRTTGYLELGRALRLASCLAMWWWWMYPGLYTPLAGPRQTGGWGVRGILTAGIARADCGLCRLYAR